MKKSSRRTFLQRTMAAAGFAAIPFASSSRPIVEVLKPKPFNAEPSIKFAAIGLNHGHINSQCEAVIRNGGQLVSFYAKEDDLAANFSKRYPNAKRAASQNEILDDPSIQLVVSASIPVDRAPL